MIKLIKNELKKIFHKKSFYIVTFLFILYTILTVFIYKNIDDNSYYDYGGGIPTDIESLKYENSNLNPNNPEDLNTYVNNLNQIELAELSKTYTSPNQKALISKYLYTIINDANFAKYYKLENATLLEANKIEAIDRVKNEDFAYFVKKDIAELKDQKSNNTNELQLKNYFISLKEYRISNNIFFDNSYLDYTLNNVENDLQYYLELANKQKRTSAEESEYQNYKAEMARNEYILKEKKDINSGGNLRGILISFHLEYAIFLLIYVIMLSGSIVSEEFNKGTIKFLLTKPYKRSTILLSKLLTVLIMLPVIIMMMYLIVILIGGIAFGFDSLSIPMVIYHSTKNTLVVQNVLAYSLKCLISVIPMYLVLMVACFMLSTITSSTSASITIAFMFYLASNFISGIATTYTPKILKAFVSLHWDFSYLVQFNKNPYVFSVGLSLLVVAIYIIIMLCLTYVYFQKKDVKNI